MRAAKGTRSTFVKKMRACSILRSAAHMEGLESRRLFTDIYVDAAANSSALTGATWQNAYRDLQSAFSASASGDRILVAQGVYRPTAGSARAATFALKNGVQVLGGFAGNLNPANPDQRLPAV